MNVGDEQPHNILRECPLVYMYLGTNAVGLVIPNITMDYVTFYESSHDSIISRKAGSFHFSYIKRLEILVCVPIQ